MSKEQKEALKMWFKKNQRISFTNLGVILTEQVKHFYEHNFKTLTNISETGNIFHAHGLVH